MRSILVALETFISSMTGWKGKTWRDTKMETIAEVITRAISDITGYPHDMINADDELYKVGLEHDHYDRLCTIIQNRYDVEVSDDDVFTWNTVEDIVRTVEELTT